MLKTIKHSITTYTKNFNLVLFFSIPLVIAFLIPLFIQLPTFPTAGGMYLRTGSLPDLNMFDILIMLFSYLLSLYLISMAIVNINLIVKSQRTTLNIKKEVLSRLGTSTINIFLLYITFTLILFLIQLLSYRLEMQNILAPILGLLASLPFFYAPAALVIDDTSPERAIKYSLIHIKRKWIDFISFLIIGFILLSSITFVILNLELGGMESILILTLNALLVMPFLIILQTQIYIAKYSLLH
ncbi:hypothetical protein KO317_03820 [Candidatus Micrarchaeota archaeon]|nr:hypothetical protein [Candidatus Micrarchaeota archaeon]